MSNTARADLRRELSRIRAPGSFCAAGTIPAVDPGLEISGFGRVVFPLSDDDAARLAAAMEPAPYGKGERTLTDANVRRALRLKADGFRPTNPEWDAAVSSLLGTVRDELGLTGREIAATLYDLLLYEPGGFFLPHRDGEKLDRMVATLVLTLPGDFAGGELVVRHEGSERVVDLAAMGDGLRYAAFYADCEHEIRPLTGGRRACLVYNVTLRDAAPPPSAEQVSTVARLLRAWREAEPFAARLVVTLSHLYTLDGLRWETLKGTDAVRAAVLRGGGGACGFRRGAGGLSCASSISTSSRSATGPGATRVATRVATGGTTAGAIGTRMR